MPTAISQPAQPVPQTPNPTTIPPKPAQETNWWMIYLLYFIIGILVLSWFYYVQFQKNANKIVTSPPTSSPSPFDLTADWKTYSSSDGQFTFQYPFNWKKASIKKVFEVVALVNREDLTEYQFSIGLLPEANPIMSRCMKQMSTEQIKIDNFPTQKIILRNDQDYQEDDSYLCYNATREELPEITQITFDHYDKQYRLEFIYPISKSNGAKVILNQILSTFKFLDNPKLAKACLENSGRWFEEFQECESEAAGFDQSTCESLGGKYFDCESPCRHNPEMENCMDVCTKVCSFSQTSQVNQANYSAPETWPRVTLLTNLNLCLPPKWETDQGGNVYFNRDSGYRPTVTYIQEIPYSGGSRREAYYKFWEGEYPDIRELVSFSEININGNTALTVQPNPAHEPKYSPEGLAVIWYAGGKLWKAGLSNWSMVNDSQTAFLKDFYTMISCSF